MGYFSNLAWDHRLYDRDHSIVEPKQQLLWRMEDLQARREELKVRGAAYCSGEYYSESDLRYLLPQHFHAIYPLEKALELVVAELKERYGVDLYPQPAEEGVDELTENQLTFWVIHPGVWRLAA